MHTLLPRLLAELEQNCQVIKHTLSAKEFDPPVDTYVLDLYRQVEQLRRKIAQLRNDPALGSAPLLARQFQEYKGFVRDLMKVEAYFLPIVLRFDNTDRYMTHLCSLLMTQANIVLAPPLVATFSTEYYWTQPNLNLICAGALECTTLLGLPDLYHEVGHLVFYKHYTMFATPFLTKLQNYIDQEKRRSLLEQRPIELATYDMLLVQWKDYWFTEFAADMIATYLVGESYGWQHLRLCSRMSDELYSPSLGEVASHPSDESRMRAIIAMLHRLSQDTPAQAITARWGSYTSALQAYAVSPGDYDQCYPDILLDTLAEIIFVACNDLSLVRAIDLVATDAISVAALINEAWQRFLANDADYPKWEQDSIQKLRSILGVEADETTP